ncbi:MAG TPA: hypothetical protein VE596_01665, partial [Gaiellaceae bacterium]|nr:hypothetical protein [Gaiellaceae bacterium]
MQLLAEVHVVPQFVWHAWPHSPVFALEPVALHRDAQNIALLRACYQSVQLDNPSLGQAGEEIGDDTKPDLRR